MASPEAAGPERSAQTGGKQPVTQAGTTQLWQGLGLLRLLTEARDPEALPSVPPVPLRLDRGSQGSMADQDPRPTHPGADQECGPRNPSCRSESPPPSQVLAPPSPITRDCICISSQNVTQISSLFGFLVRLLQSSAQRSRSDTEGGHLPLPPTQPQKQPPASPVPQVGAAPGGPSCPGHVREDGPAQSQGGVCACAGDRPGIPPMWT